MLKDGDKHQRVAKTMMVVYFEIPKLCVLMVDIIYGAVKADHQKLQDTNKLASWADRTCHLWSEHCDDRLTMV